MEAKTVGLFVTLLFAFLTVGLWGIFVRETGPRAEVSTLILGLLPICAALACAFALAEKELTASSQANPPSTEEV